MPDPNVFISGLGWVTPLGSGVSHVWQRLLDGETAPAQMLTSDLSARTYPAFRVPAEALKDAPIHPRLRRASAISRFAVIAGLAALKDAAVTLDPESAARTAIIYAISNGGVIYTKRFYHEVVESGAQAASPLLFPETVFNAPASHLAAIVGITGASYTLVGDGAVGLLALEMGRELMQNDALDRCLVIGAEEADWLLCDAYRRWRLLATEAPAQVFRTPPRGFVLSEGAGAALLTRDGPLAIDKIEPGHNYRRQIEAAVCIRETLQKLGPEKIDVFIASANGTFVDQAEQTALQAIAPGALIYAPKMALGDSIGASALWQTICAAQILRTGQVPPTPGFAEKRDATDFRRVVVSGCGMNQQVAALALRAALA